MLNPGILIVTGTDTDVGKTVATAAIAHHLFETGRPAFVVKPYQTGLQPGEAGDVDDICVLAGLGRNVCEEWSRLPEPLAPTRASARAGVTLPTVRETAERLVALTKQHDHVVVEGSGGVLVGLDNDGATLLDLARTAADLGAPVSAVVVARAGLGTLNHAALTVTALRGAGVDVAGIVVGAMPAEPDLAERCNLEDLPRIAPLLAVLPAGIGRDPDAVQRASASLAGVL